MIIFVNLSNTLVYFYLQTKLKLKLRTIWCKKKINMLKRTFRLIPSNEIANRIGNKSISICI